MPIRFKERKKDEEIKEPDKVEDVQEETEETEKPEESGFDYEAIGRIEEALTRIESALIRLDDMAESLSILATEGVYINDVANTEDLTKAEDVNQDKEITDLLNDLDFKM